ncbi:hypothetical protein DERF_002733 [Dermatophagoides farinae]|uniref:Elongator complex protein 5 n=1 Tax=Dermatophagoides farinae TaxID=6954 RepID=A0A922IB76_DERFA|nr:hypothetical protein DERF_002733 [Dermatophagoides farinae]
MSDKKKIVVEKTCLLQDIWDESTRLQPLMLTLIDDLETLTQQTIFLGHFIDRLVLKNSSRNFFLLSFGTNEQHFYRHDQIKSNTKIQILNEHDFRLSDTAQEKLNKDDNDSTQLPQSSFRLTLTKQEEEARENLVLPYIKKQNSQPTNSNTATTQSPEFNIIYTYDKFDDIDDEDPDDDLDF